MFEAIRTLYRTGRITAEGVLNAVRRGLITSEQYEIITGAEYPQ